MRLWRLTRLAHISLNGAGAQTYGGRYSSPGLPVVSFASEAGLAVLVALRYLPANSDEWHKDYVLGWTEVSATVERIPDTLDEDTIREHVDDWLRTSRSLLASVCSRVLPECEVILFNPTHPEANSVPRLTFRPFDFADCLHRPPMLDRFPSRQTQQGR